MRNQSQRASLFAALSSGNDTRITLGSLATRAANGLADVISSTAATIVDDVTVFGAACVLTQLAINAGLTNEQYIARESRKAALRAELLLLEAE